MCMTQHILRNGGTQLQALSQALLFLSYQVFKFPWKSLGHSLHGLRFLQEQRAESLSKNHFVAATLVFLYFCKTEFCLASRSCHHTMPDK